MILVYDTSSRTSFAGMDAWFDEVEVNTVPGVALYLVGAKADRVPRAVSPEEGRALAAARGAGFCEVSAKTGGGVRGPFVELVDAVVGDAALLREVDGGRAGATVRVGGGGGDGVGEEGGAGCSC